MRKALECELITSTRKVRPAGFLFYRNKNTFWSKSVFFLTKIDKVLI